VLSQSPPRLITTDKIVHAGTSGGITLLGTLTALLGAIFIGAIAIVTLIFLCVLMPLVASRIASPAFPLTPSLFLLPLLAGTSGIIGALFDSVVGATVQAIYFCDYDQKETERRVHSCGRVTRLIRGWTWLDNDAVNFLASVFGSGLAALLWYFLLS